MSIADILDKAADLIEPEGAFDPGPIAKNAAGKDVDPRDSSAVCWCAVGATWRAAVGTDHGYGCDADRFFAAVHTLDPSEYADHHSQAEVVAAFREAAAKAREQGL